MKARNDDLDGLPAELEAIRRESFAAESEYARELTRVPPTMLASARNLIHYLAFRRRDLRGLQHKLAVRGFSSLGRAEGHVLATIDAVLARLGGASSFPDLSTGSTVGFDEGRRILDERTALLLGPLDRGPPERTRRAGHIMVTMPSEAAVDFELVRGLILAGMDCMRINCAHDAPPVWEEMVRNLGRARRETGCECRLLMDLAGPKLRTGPMEPGPRAVFFSPHRDPRGVLIAPALVWLTPDDVPDPAPEGIGTVVPLPRRWLDGLQVSDEIHFDDLRQKRRALKVVRAEGASRVAESLKTTYLGAETVLNHVHGLGEPGSAEALPPVKPLLLAPVHQSIDLFPGDVLVLAREPIPARPVVRDAEGRAQGEARISCTLPEVFACVRPGERIWFDDGKIGGEVIDAGPDALRVRIGPSAAEGKTLREDKGINLPDSRIDVSAITEKDRVDLDFVVRHADLVGLSFIQRPEDVEQLESELCKRTERPLGIVLKIETRRAFDRLPQILLAALRSRPTGVMIARGDLAVECGYERLAEVQEEILWLCEAAHMPSVWATQVLERLSKKGQPSRAEITDAAMGRRAECVMLNKGPHVVEAVRMLLDILASMGSHQEKKSALLRPLGVSRRRED